MILKRSNTMEVLMMRQISLSHLSFEKEKNHERTRTKLRNSETKKSMGQKEKLCILIKNNLIIHKCCGNGKKSLTKKKKKFQIQSVRLIV